MAKNKDDGTSGFPAGSRLTRPHHPDGWTHKRDTTPPVPPPSASASGYAVGDPNRGKPK